jgi:hypothetical protein
MTFAVTMTGLPATTRAIVPDSMVINQKNPAALALETR